VARDKMEMDELRRLHEEKRRERLEPMGEDGEAQYEWDGLRRRKTVYGSRRSRAMTSPTATAFQPIPESPHPPLGWSHFPTDEELAAARDAPASPNVLTSIAGTIRTRARSVLLQGSPDAQDPTKVQSPMHPVQLTEIAVPKQQPGDDAAAYFGQEPRYGLPAGKTDYDGGSGPRVQFGGDSRQASQGSLASSAVPPDGPPHAARRQFSFQNVFRRHQQAAAAAAAGPEPVYEERPRRPGITTRGYSNPHVKDATEEERLGLVQGDSRSMPQLPTFGDDAEEADPYGDDKQLRYGRGITTPPRRGSDEKSASGSEVAEYEARRKRFNDSRAGSQDRETPTPPPAPGSRRHSPPRGGDGSFI